MSRQWSLFCTFGTMAGLLLSCSRDPTGVEIPPLAPQALVPAHVYNQTFTARWTQVVEADGYRLDVATDSLFANCLSGYQDRDAGRADSAVVAGVTAGTSYWYRVRAVNRYGASAPSNRMAVITYPTDWDRTVPRTVDATDITSTGFTAHWYAPMKPYQWSYYLEVSADSLFLSYLPGYSHKDVGNNLQARVTGLRRATPYYYRVRAVYAGVATDNSNTIQVILPPFFDVFPLAKGAQFHYTYLDTLLLRDLYPQWILKDSGYVEYRVLDFVQAGNSILNWTVEEYRHLLHEEYHYNGPKATFDLVTSRWIDSTVTLDLTEDLHGLHELRCSGLIWSFPAQVMRGYADTLTASIYRLALNSRSFVVAMYDQNNIGAVTRKDSLVFAADSALTYRLFTQSGWANSASRGEKECWLVWCSNLPAPGAAEALPSQRRRLH